MLSKGKALILGMGITGRAYADYLASQGIAFVCADTRQQPPMLNTIMQNHPGTHCITGQFQEKLLDDIDQVLISPGISSCDKIVSAAKNRNLPVYSDIDIFMAMATTPVIGITGSNGKSTVTSMLNTALNQTDKKAVMAGNIGVPVLDLLGFDTPDYYVLELSSFQLDLSQTLPLAAATVLNISADHMDKYNSMQEYIDSKLSIYRQAKIAIVNLDQPSAKQESFTGEVMTFSAENPQANVFYNISDNAFYINGEHTLCANDTKLQGRHNYLNISTVLCIGLALHVDMQYFIKGICQFTGLPHRCEWVADYKGAAWINDSKATNIGATLAALQGFQRPIILIAGGDAKGADFTQLAAALPEHVRMIITLGKDAKQIEAAVGNRVAFMRVTDMQSAVQQAANIVQTNDCVLLSPACSSLDMYSDYQQRGQAFIAAVNKVCCL